MKFSYLSQIDDPVVVLLQQKIIRIEMRARNTGKKIINN